MNDLQWAEELPDKCPPQGAYTPDGGVFYRVVKGDPAKEEDFFSQRKLAPKRHFKGVSECVTRAVSVFSQQECAVALTKLPKFKNGCCVAKLHLHPKDGLVQQTGKNASHYSWWRTKDFQIASAQIISFRPLCVNCL